MTEIQGKYNSDGDSDVEITEPEIPIIDLDTSGTDVVSLVDDDNNMLFELKFTNKVMYEKCKDVIALIRSYYEQSEDMIKIDEDGLTIKYYDVTEKISQLSAKKGTRLEDLFVIDTNPVQNISSTVPSYKRATGSVLTDEEPKQEDPFPARPSRRSVQCFNCCGEHSIKDCPEPRNPHRIVKNRKQFSTNKQTERYHIDIEQRYGHLQPGKPSRHLLEALGIYSARRLPHFFYRMRELGYPPGWLEHIKVRHSGLTLFDSEGKEILESDQEDGEVSCDKCKYDVNKIIDFPGFNVNAPDYCVDETKYYGAPPMQKEHRKEAFIKSLAGSVATAYRKKKLKRFFGKTADEMTTELTPVDMEIEDIPEDIQNRIEFIRPHPPPEPPEGIPPLPPSPPADILESKEDTTAKTIDEDEITLEDLQKKQLELMSELQNTSVNSTRTEDDSLIDDILSLDETTENGSQDSKLTNSQADSSISRRSTGSEPPNKKRSILGTPVLKFSPYERLPPGENFCVGVSDVINFENLPDSTGKYEQMKTVLAKVRTVARRLQSEIDD